MGNANCCAAQKPKMAANQAGKRPIRQPGGDSTLPEINKQQEAPNQQDRSKQSKTRDSDLVMMVTTEDTKSGIQKDTQQNKGATF